MASRIMAMDGNTGTILQLPYHFIPPTIPTLHTHHIPSTPHRSRLYVATFLAQCVRVPLEGKRSNKGLQAKEPTNNTEVERAKERIFVK